MRIVMRVKWSTMMFAILLGTVVCFTVAMDVQGSSVEQELFRSTTITPSAELPSPKMVHKQRTRVVASTAMAPVDRSEGRFFLKISDITSHIIQQNIESVPAPLRGPVLFFMGFSQQSIENMMSNVRSVGRMLITSLVMMAVKRMYFSDLPTEADRNKASQLTDSILNMVNLVF